MDLIKSGYYNVEDVHISEKEKNTFRYLKDSVDHYITTLVKDKTRIRKARNLYDGRRDREEFRYLEETFGIETPIRMKMTSLVKTRVDLLVGLLLDEVFTFRVTVNDANTITQVEDNKRAAKIKGILEGYDKQLSDNISKSSMGQPPEQSVVTAKYLENLTKSIDENFISEFEIAAMSLIKFFEQDITIDLQQKVKQYFIDLLVTGEAYYKTSIERIGEDPVLEIKKPENVHYKKNTNHQYISSGHRPNVSAVVNTEEMERSEILRRYGHFMSQDVKDKVFGEAGAGTSGRIISDPRYLGKSNMGDLHDSGTRSQFVNDDYADTIPVYYVEWLANNEIEIKDEEYKEGIRQVEDITMSKEHTKEHGKDAGSGKPRKKSYRLDRYEGIRIGLDTYICLGKSKHTPRSASKPWLTTLSINGLAYNDRNGTPYSTALALKDLQDSFDIIVFFRDNLIANSGLDGSRINMAAIPKVLGQDYMERILKFIHFRKQGLEFIDPTEDGANMFSGYGNFQGSLSSGALQELNLVLESIQSQADMVTGINRYMYQAAEQKDAVTNVKVGQKQASLITKDLFSLVHTGQKHILTDLINRAKVCYKRGKRGTYILGDRVLVFDIKSNNFCFTDYNIHVVNNTIENLKLERLNSVIPDFVSAGIIDPDVMMDIIMSDSPTEIKRLIKRGTAKKREENNQLMGMQQQLQQTTEQMNQVQSELEKSNKQLNALINASDNLKSREVAVKEGELDYKRRDSKERLNLERQESEQKSEKAMELIKLEREQLYLSADGNAKEIRNDI
tara:strand:- start:5202 stop:7568 length:2367 start_codon:yes stop_codon:yes gene_type:complete